jgi:hypothetical protein
MRLIVFTILTLLAALPALTAPAVAKQPQRQQQSSDLLDVVFTEIEKRLIREYYAGRTNAAAADSLPPGMRKRLARGKGLPPGIAKKYLPSDLEGRLPARTGIERRVIGSDVVLVAVATNIVLDIIFDAIKHG